MDSSEMDLTKLLSRLGKGDAAAESDLIRLVMPRLRRLAAYYMSAERLDHTLQPTALVNEAYLRLLSAKDLNWQNQAQFFGLSAKLMRQILVDHARTRNAKKRFGLAVDIEDVLVYTDEKSSMVLALDELLDRLANTDARLSRVVELRFFGGLTFDQIGQVLQVSAKTAKRDWQLAKAWLQREIRKS